MPSKNIEITQEEINQSCTNEVQRTLFTRLKAFLDSQNSEVKTLKTDMTRAKSDISSLRSR